MVAPGNDNKQITILPVKSNQTTVLPIKDKITPLARLDTTTKIAQEQQSFADVGLDATDLIKIPRFRFGRSCARGYAR